MPAPDRPWSAKLLVLTDLHLTGNGQRIIGLDPLARTSALLSQALARHPDAEALILMGDLAHSGEVAAYRQLRDILSRVPLPVIPMLGNHDLREAFLSVFGDAPVSPGGFVQGAFDFGGWRVLTTDTLAGPPYADFLHSGFLSQDRQDWLAAEVEAARGRNLLVCCHHPPFKTGIPGMDIIALERGDWLLDLLAGHGRAYLLAGHIHRTISGVTRGVPWSMIKSPCHQSPLEMEDIDSTLALDEPGGYGVALLTPEGVVVHHEDMATEGSTVYAGYPDL